MDDFIDLSPVSADRKAGICASRNIAYWIGKVFGAIPGNGQNSLVTVALVRRQDAVKNGRSVTARVRKAGKRLEGLADLVGLVERDKDVNSLDGPLVKDLDGGMQIGRRRVGRGLARDQCRGAGRGQWGFRMGYCWRPHALAMEKPHFLGVG